MDTITTPSTRKRKTIRQLPLLLAFWVFLLALLFTLAFSGCGPFPAVSTTLGVPAAAITPLATVEPIAVSHRPYLIVEAWFDITSSVYPSSYFTKAVLAVANAIDQSIQLNEDGATIYIGLINHNSFRSESTVMVITIPPLPSDPTRPTLLPMPQTTGDPYKDAQNQRKVASENNKTLETWQQVLLDNHVLLAKAQAQVKQQTDQLRHLSPKVDNQATDVHGALERASMRFRTVFRGVKYLVLETDLEENTDEQDTGSLNLFGVHVKVFFHPCENASACQSNDTHWRQVLSTAGVKDMSIIDPSQSQTIQNLFS